MSDVKDLPINKSDSDKAKRGRPFGAANLQKRTFFEAIARRKFDCANTLVDLYECAIKEFHEGHPDDKATYLKIAGDMAKEITSHVVPKLKAIEVSGALDVTVDRKEIDALKEKLRLAHEAATRS